MHVEWRQGALLRTAHHTVVYLKQHKPRFHSFLPFPSFLPSFLPCFLPSFLPCFLPCFHASFLASPLPSFLPTFLCPNWLQRPSTYTYPHALAHSILIHNSPCWCLGVRKHLVFHWLRICTIVGSAYPHYSMAPLLLVLCTLRMLVLCCIHTVVVGLGVQWWSCEMYGRRKHHLKHGRPADIKAHIQEQHTASWSCAMLHKSVE